MSKRHLSTAILDSTSSDSDSDIDVSVYKFHVLKKIFRCKFTANKKCLRILKIAAEGLLLTNVFR